MLEIGVGRADITCTVPGIGLMGWGLHEQKADGVAAPLFARAFVVRDPATGGKIALVCCDLWGITQSIRQAVLDALAAEHAQRGFGEANLMLVATHTHSAPGGYSHFVFYNASVPGFCAEVRDTIIAGVLKALIQADEGRVPGRVRWARGTVDGPVAFNRSPSAYNRNPEVEPVTWEDRGRATDRRMSLLRFEDATGRPLGLASFFAVHGTSVHSSWSLIHPDNKGCAATLVEAESGDPDFVAIFAQGAAGDVSPNFRWDRARKLMIGALDDDVASAEHNGALQARCALDLMEAAARGASLEGLDAAILYADFERMEVDPTFTGGREGRTSGAAVGLSMVMGTAEGWGPLFPWRRTVGALNTLAGAVRRVRGALSRLTGGRYDGWETHRNKAFFADTGRGPDATAFHLFSLANPPLPPWLDRGVWYFRTLTARGAIGEHPFTPTILPVQALRLGPVVIVGVQGEPTTVAGLRLEATALARLAPAGVTDVVVAGYANAYAGYTTTAEEYVAQCYEGGSTLFGQWSLAATQTVLDRLAADLLVPPDRRSVDRGPSPHRFDEEELRRRAFPLTS